MSPDIVITKEFKFEAAHSLPYLPEGHKCRNVHGHSYRVKVVCKGPVVEEFGWVVDFSELSLAMKEVISLLDHSYLNDIMETKTTAEMLAIWIFEKIRPKLSSVLTEVHVSETQSTWAVFSA